MSLPTFGQRRLCDRATAATTFLSLFSPFLVGKGSELRRPERRGEEEEGRGREVMNTNASPFSSPPNPNPSYWVQHFLLPPLLDLLPSSSRRRGEEERGLFTTPPPPLSHTRARQKNKESRGGDDAQICGKLARAKVRVCSS